MNDSTHRVVVGVTGGVAAYKAAELVRALQQRGAEVRVTMTRAAQEFVQPLTFSSITGHKTITTMWGEGAEPACGLDGTSDPAPFGSYQGAVGRRSGKPALRDAGAKPVVADGLQGLGEAWQ